MSAETKVTCDGCSDDITYTDGMAEQSLALVLRHRRVKDHSAPVHCALIAPLIDETKHFCGFDCLRKWLGDKPAPRAMIRSFKAEAA
ncbi:hypothetical protein CHELA1G11_13011 [Hyphomicrobiales bacterium]|nr:hypothetical protein CHELA1G2_11299 [Hyphomicrobiales bacterium]CAH1668681.1 hypothetical protein CHELA1G11_13011 [Hyphomicrobiales bacterium]